MHIKFCNVVLLVSLLFAIVKTHKIQRYSTLETPGQAGKLGRVTCYFTNWAVHRKGEARYSVRDIPIQKCTHLVYSFVGLSDQTWELISLDPKLDITQSNFLQFVRLRKKNPLLKLSVAVGGWAEGGLKYSEMVNDPDKRCNFTRSVTDFFARYDFDGLDIDWEYPAAENRDGLPTDKLAFLQLVRDLRHAFDQTNPRWEITIAVPVAEVLLQDGYYVSELCSLVNAVHLMAYDLRTVGSIGNHTYNSADTHTPLYQRPHDKGILHNLNVYDGTYLWINQGCSRDKLVVGTAFYGRSFTLIDHEMTKPGEAPINPDDGQGDPAEYTQERGYIAYFEICERILRKYRTGEVWNQGYDEIGRVPYIHRGSNWIGFEDEDSLQIKVDWIKEEGLAGVMNWAIDLDDWRGICGTKDALINVLSNGMKNYVVPRLPKREVHEKYMKAPAVSETNCEAFSSSQLELDNSYHYHYSKVVKTEIRHQQKSSYNYTIYY